VGYKRSYSQQLAKLLNLLFKRKRREEKRKNEGEEEEGRLKEGEGE
jgi:hypothetical protein